MEKAIETPPLQRPLVQDIETITNWNPHRPAPLKPTSEIPGMGRNGSGPFKSEPNRDVQELNFPEYARGAPLPVGPWRVFQPQRGEAQSKPHSGDHPSLHKFILAAKSLVPLRVKLDKECPVMTMFQSNSFTLAKSTEA
jgi:hypothetical protein